jgi:hypothetical protein
MKILIPSSLALLAKNALCDSTEVLSSALVAAAEIRDISRSLPEQLVSWKCKCASQVCDFLEAFLSNHKEVFPWSDFGQSNASHSASNALSESINLAILWAIGGDMTELQRQKFSTWAVDAFDFDNHNLPQNLFHCFFNGDSWLDWNDHVPQTIFYAPARPPGCGYGRHRQHAGSHFPNNVHFALVRNALAVSSPCAVDGTCSCWKISHFERKD